MPETTNAPTTTVLPKTEQPKLHKVILLNDDYTPREFVVRVLKGEFGMNEGSASRVMMTAHQRGACVMRWSGHVRSCKVIGMNGS